MHFLTANSIARLLRLAVLLLLFPLASCDQVDNETVDKLASDLQKTLDDVKRGVDQLTPHVESAASNAGTTTSEEFRKLFIFEYKVMEIKHSVSVPELEATLNVLGRERWECYTVQSTSDGLRLFLKRRPESYFRYVPRIFP
jgi:hypothetical protein